MLPTELGVDLPPDAVAALQRGAKIEAIKIVREARALSLKGAKEAVEAYAAQHPELAASARSSAGVAGPGMWMVLTVLLATIALVGFVYARG